MRKPLDPHDTERQADEGVGLALFELAPRLTRLENSVLREVDPPLTFRQYRILGRVAEGHTTLTALGKLATISLPAVSESVEGLVRKGLLQRTADTHDRRAVQLQLTTEGEKSLEDAQRLLEAAARELLAGLMVTDHRVAFEDDLREIADRVTSALLAARKPGTGEKGDGSP
ncbi:MarR family transcriptional regulator [Egibacter rhizosphaerae]|uniref:MarR family transcriptional regulator n=1 Tax=Egibacter rhizosphaerae TaxID=1670831 RepID=A0A411YHB0_9ACTN|nr:MarR family transcriptional regulator [Egibacter rhizosphaerae]QBI20496.1 MarR family transcriptional regulator [Egibacter rhizosphaerae]